jgi:hypothetical protein
MPPISENVRLRIFEEKWIAFLSGVSQYRGREHEKRRV